MSANLTKTLQKVWFGGHEYAVYQGKRGGKYIKQNGVTTRLKKTGGGASLFDWINPVLYESGPLDGDGLTFRIGLNINPPYVSPNGGQSLIHLLAAFNDGNQHDQHAKRILEAAKSILATADTQVYTFPNTDDTNEKTIVQQIKSQSAGTEFEQQIEQELSSIKWEDINVTLYHLTKNPYIYHILAEDYKRTGFKSTEPNPPEAPSPETYVKVVLGGKCMKKTCDRVQMGGRNAIVYEGPRGGRYIKKAGEYVSVKKAIKRLN